LFGLGIVKHIIFIALGVRVVPIRPGIIETYPQLFLSKRSSQGSDYILRVKGIHDAVMDVAAFGRTNPAGGFFARNTSNRVNLGLGVVHGKAIVMPRCENEVLHARSLRKLCPFIRIETRWIESLVQREIDFLKLLRGAL